MERVLSCKRGASRIHPSIFQRRFPFPPSLGDVVVRTGVVAAAKASVVTAAATRLFGPSHWLLPSSFSAVVLLGRRPQRRLVAVSLKAAVLPSCSRNRLPRRRAVRTASVVVSLEACVPVNCLPAPDKQAQVLPAQLLQIC